MTAMNSSICDIEPEVGELPSSSDDVHTPLQRPKNLTDSTVTSDVVSANNADQCSPPATCRQTKRAVEVDDLDDIQKSKLSDMCLQNQSMVGWSDSTASTKQDKPTGRTIMIRIPSSDAEMQDKGVRLKRYNIWTKVLQDDLAEDMRSCNVAQAKGTYDRSVENYDFSLRRRFKMDDSFKRCLSNSTSQSEDNSLKAVAKRDSCASKAAAHTDSVKSHLADRPPKSRGRRDSSHTSGCAKSYDPHRILDLDPLEEREPSDVAREMAKKLNEPKYDLILRALEILGTKLPAEIFKETQQIEAEGGMLVINGQRRRTPGGLFLHLLKNHVSLTAEQHKSIFAIDRQQSTKWRKKMEAQTRDRKVEEYMKHLSEREKDLPVLSSRKQHFLLGCNFKTENQPNRANIEDFDLFQTCHLEEVENDPEDVFEYKPRQKTYKLRL